MRAASDHEGSTPSASDSRPSASDSRPSVVLLCTGNAARSVMAGAMLSAAPVRLVTAGTHVVEGQPMSRRTRTALEAVGLDAGGHRSRQLGAGDLESATLIVAMAGEHVAFVRRVHPEAAARTATIKRLCRDLDGGPLPLAARVRALGLAGTDIEPWEDVDDPAGGEDADYLACAEELRGLCRELAARLGSG